MMSYMGASVQAELLLYNLFFIKFIHLSLCLLPSVQFLYMLLCE